MVTSPENQGQSLFSFLCTNDGKFCFSGGTYRAYKWDLNEGTVAAKWPNHAVKSFESVLPEQIITATSTNIIIRKMPTDSVIKSFEFEQCITTVKYIDNGQNIIVYTGSPQSGIASYTGELFGIDIETRDQVFHREDDLGIIAAYPGKGILAASLFKKAMVKIETASTGNMVTSIPTNANICALEFSQDGSMLAVACFDKSLTIFDTKHAIPVSNCRGSNIVTALRFSPDGTILASGANNKKVKLWDCASGRCVGTLGQHEDKVIGIAWLNATTIISACMSGGIYIWDHAKKSLRGILVTTNGGDWLVKATDGRFDCSDSFQEIGWGYRENNPPGVMAVHIEKTQLPGPFTPGLLAQLCRGE